MIANGFNKWNVDATVLSILCGSFPKFIGSRTRQIRPKLSLAVSNALIARAHHDGAHIGNVCA